MKGIGSQVARLQPHKALSADRSSHSAHPQPHRYRRRLMVMFDPHSRKQSEVFDLELERLSNLVSDMHRIREGIPVEELAGKFPPFLDNWFRSERPAPCLVGSCSGHPRLTGTGRLIVTSDLWLMSSDGKWARTLSRWYRLGDPAPLSSPASSASSDTGPSASSHPHPDGEGGRSD
jgi:hypothetical protein